MTLDEFRELTKNLPGHTEFWMWNEDSGAWSKCCYINIGIQNIQHKDIIWMDQRHLEDEKNENCAAWNKEIYDGPKQEVIIL